jgi:hypothetical protein
MSNSEDSFDAMAIVIDWIEACREGRLEDLIGLYADGATVDCCRGGRFAGQVALRRYWKPKLQNRISGSFEIDNLAPELRGVCLDYRDYDGQAVRTHFRFSPNGKITHTACSPVAGDGTRPMAA